MKRSASGCHPGESRDPRGTAADLVGPGVRRDDSCSRCGAPFHCGVADAQPCWCTGIKLHAATLAELARGSSGCLCPACLADAAEKETAGR